MSIHKPQDAGELARIVAGAAASGRALDIMGGGSKRALGQAREDHAAQADTVELSEFSGIVAYEPSELVLTAGAATPLPMVEALLAERGQMLAFEPPDWRALLGSGDRTPTLGGILATNLSGPRRFKAGAARDHFLGFQAVNGRGEEFKAGGRVVKNVTGYDLCKLMAGSYGTLAILTEVTVKVLPRPETERTLLLRDPGMTALTAAPGTPHEVSGAAHLPWDGITALRVEGFGPSVEYRCRALRELLDPSGAAAELDADASAAFWRELREVHSFFAAGDFPVLWRLSVPPAEAARILETLVPRLSAKACLDWGGGLVWLGLPAEREGEVATIRAELRDCGGHATLIRGGEAFRRAVAVFEPPAPALRALSERVKDSFDPCHILNPGRLYRGS